VSAVFDLRKTLHVLVLGTGILIMSLMLARHFGSAPTVAVSLPVHDQVRHVFSVSPCLRGESFALEFVFVLTERLEFVPETRRRDFLRRSSRAGCVLAAREMPKPSLTSARPRSSPPLCNGCWGRWKTYEEAQPARARALDRVRADWVRFRIRSGSL